MNEKLKAMFPRGSKAFFSANANPQLSHPILKPDAKDALDRKTKGKGTRHDRVTVCVTSFRTRLLDLDNCQGGNKALLDCIREVGLIRDDNPESIELTVRQEKVSHRSQEKTVVQLICEDINQRVKI